MIYELWSIHDHMVNLTGRASNYLNIYIFFPTALSDLSELTEHPLALACNFHKINNSQAINLTITVAF